MSETPTCAKRVAGDGWGRRNCSNAGKYEEDGKFWCGVHLPSKVAARRAERDEREWAERDAHIAKEQATQDATAALIAAALAFIDLKGIDIVAWASLREAVAAYRKATEGKP